MKTLTCAALAALTVVFVSPSFAAEPSTQDTPAVEQAKHEHKKSCCPMMQKQMENAKDKQQSEERALAHDHSAMHQHDHHATSEGASAHHEHQH